MPKWVVRHILKHKLRTLKTHQAKSLRTSLQSNTSSCAGFRSWKKTQHNICKKQFSGPLRSRTEKAIGFIDMMNDYSLENSPLQKELFVEEVRNTAAFLASTITGAVVYVDNGLNAIGVGVDSPTFENLNDIPKDKQS